MSKEEIVECLNHSKQGNNHRKLLEFCRDPKAYNDLRKAGVKGGDMIKVLGALKMAGALGFADGKYFATPIGLEVLDSL